jgi:hypothetical protein
MIEQWKPIPGYEGTYEVSNIGNVRRLAGSERCFVTRPRKLVPRNGYFQLILSKNGEVELQWAHRLVARAFLGEPNKNFPHVNHKNGVRTDNRVENLEWVNHSENIAHAYRIGLKSAAPNPGEKNGNAFLKDSDIPKIRERASSGESLASIGRSYKAARQIIWRIVKRKSWAHIP